MMRLIIVESTELCLVINHRATSFPLWTIKGIQLIHCDTKPPRGWCNNTRHTTHSNNRRFCYLLFINGNFRLKLIFCLAWGPLFRVPVDLMETGLGLMLEIEKYCKRSINKRTPIKLWYQKATQQCLPTKTACRILTQIKLVSNPNFQPPIYNQSRDQTNRGIFYSGSWQIVCSNTFTLTSLSPCLGPYTAAASFCQRRMASWS